MEKRFLELDALRGFAALAVAVFHYTNRAAHAGHPLFPFAFGAHGVQLFFCISGFVIYWTLERSRTLTDFAVSRFSRLYPTYWCALVLLILLDALSGVRPWWGGYARDAAMVQTFLGWPDVDIVYWTLGIELAFYVWMAAVFATRSMHRMVMVAMIWLAICIVCGLTHVTSLAPWLIYEHAPYFLAGVMFYRIRCEGWRWPYGLVIIAAGLAVCVISQTPLLVSVVFGIFALAISGKLGWIVNRATVWLGTVSYSLYLTHRAFGGWILGRLLNADVPGYLALMLALSAAIALASLVTVVIERPALRAIRALYRPHYAKIQMTTG